MTKISTSVGTYRSRPVDVKAIQYDGTDASVEAIQEWTSNDSGYLEFSIYNKVRSECELYVAKSDAWCRVHLNDWVVMERDASGFYPVTGADFDQRYETLWSAKNPQTRGSRGK